MRSWPTCQTHWPRLTPPSGTRKSSSHRPQTTLLILTNHKRRLRVFDRHSSEAPIKPSIPLLLGQSERRRPANCPVTYDVVREIAGADNTADQALWMLRYACQIDMRTFRCPTAGPMQMP